MGIANNVTELIGHTPLVRLNRIPQEEGCLAEIVVVQPSFGERYLSTALFQDLEPIEVAALN